MIIYDCICKFYCKKTDLENLNINDDVEFIVGEYNNFKNNSEYIEFEPKTLSEELTILYGKNNEFIHIRHSIERTRYQDVRVNCKINMIIINNKMKTI